jgi:hypothetical protein
LGIVHGRYWRQIHQNGIDLVMKAARRRKPDLVTPRTIRFPESLRLRIAADAERCGRSFDAQVVAILRRHYGDDVDIAPAPDLVLALARGSVEGLSAHELRELSRGWKDRDDG